MAGQVLQMGVYMHDWCVDAARSRKELMHKAFSVLKCTLL